MPFKPRHRFRRRRRHNPMATATRMMTKSYAFKRHNQVATKVFWFKLAGLTNVDQAGSNLAIFRTRGINGTTVPVGKQEVFSLYDQFKVLAMRVRWFPANVGTEPGSGVAGPLQPYMARGNQVVWSDQRVDATLQVPQFVTEVINNASARMINPRRPYTRVIYRPKGVPNWGSCVDYSTTPDSWNGAVYQLINDATPAGTSGRPVWFYTLTYKVLVRGRRQN